MKDVVKVSYITCAECGMMVRLSEVGDIPAHVNAVAMYAGACPQCKTAAGLTFAPPAPRIIAPVTIVPNLSKR